MRKRVDVSQASATVGAGRIGMLGAGNFATQVLLPAVAAAGGHLETIVSSGGTSATVAAGKFGARHASSDPDDVLGDPSIDTVLIATRHDSHARYAEQALRAGKNAFVEKPLAITADELEALRGCIEEVAGSGRLPLLGIGFNRRFARISVRMAQLLAGQRLPKALILTMNAGTIAPSHWTQDVVEGGGRIVGEACHMIDLARFLVGAPITDVHSVGLEGSGPRDTASISLSFDDGSVATVHYFGNGSKRYPKERVEAFCGGRVLVNENFRTMKAYGWPGVRTMRLRAQDKGHTAGVAAFLDAVRRGGPAPIPLDEILEVSAASLRAAGIA
jgi:predicted dehydrogenase